MPVSRHILFVARLSEPTASAAAVCAALYFTNHFFDTNATGWRVIRFAFVGYAIQLAASCLYVFSWWVDNYIRKKNRTRVVLPKMTPLDLERREYAADYRRQQMIKLGGPKSLSNVQKRGGAKPTIQRK